MEFKDLIFYEIYPNSYLDTDGDGFGDLQGIISKLDYIQGLGFNAIWLNPIYTSPFKDGGYDVSDPYLVDKRFGTNDDLKELIEKMHQRNMVLFLDLVPGHVSIQEKTFLKSSENVPNEEYDTFIWNNNVWNYNPKYRFISGMFDRNGCYMVNFFAHQAAINYGFNEIDDPSYQIPYKEAKKGREYIEKIMKFYLDMGVDGFRCDMADSLVKNDPSKKATIWTWKKIREDLYKQGVKKFYMTSEWSNPHRSLQAGFDSDFVLDHHDNFSHHLFRQGENGFTAPLLVNYNSKLYEMFVKDVNKRLLASKRFKGQLSLISGNHDTWRIANYLNQEELKLAYLFLFTFPGVPYLYYGDEIGMHTDTSLPSFEGGFQRTGSRTPMRWDASLNAGFSTSGKTFLPTNKGDTTVEEEERDSSSLLNVIKELIALRKSHEEFTSYDFHFVDFPLGYKRKDILVLINLKDEEASYSVKGNILYKLGDARYENGECHLAKHAAIVIQEEK